jgi:hypothetical protein
MQRVISGLRWLGRSALGLEVFSEQFAASIGDRVHPLAADEVGCDEIAILEQLKRRINRGRLRAKAALLLNLEHDVVAVPWTVLEDPEDVALDAIPLRVGELNV